MKNMFLKGIACAGLLLLMGSCNMDSKSAATVIDKDQIKKDVQDRENEYAAIYNSGEIKKIGYYADDAVTFYQNKTINGGIFCISKSY